MISDTQEKYQQLQKVIKEVAVTSGYKNEKDLTRSMSKKSDVPVALGVPSVSDTYSTDQNYSNKPNYANIITINSQSQLAGMKSQSIINDQKSRILELEQKCHSLEAELEQSK